MKAIMRLAKSPSYVYRKVSNRETYVLGKSSPKKRPHDRRNAHDGTKCCNIYRPFSKRQGVHHNYDRPVHDTGSSEASNGASDNEACRSGCGTTDGRPELEDDDEGQKDLFGRIESVHAAEQKHESGRGKIVRTSIPTRISECMEMIGDIWHGGRDDRAVLEGYQHWIEMFRPQYWECTRDVKNMAK